MRASWYAAASVCAAPLMREVSIALVRFGMERPATTTMIATTTTSSVSVKPDCKARFTLDLAVDFTILTPSPLQHLRKNFTQARSHLEHQINTRGVGELWRVMPKITGERVTCVSELLYRNILSQPGTRLRKDPANGMNLKELFLFRLNQKSCINLRLSDTLQLGLGAVN
jgi:hypothetical protein